MLFRTADSRLDRPPVSTSLLKPHQKIDQEREEIQLSRQKRQSEFDAWQRAWQQVLADMAVDLDRLTPPSNREEAPLVLRPPRIVM